MIIRNKITGQEFDVLPGTKYPIKFYEAVEGTKATQEEAKVEIVEEPKKVEETAKPKTTAKKTTKKRKTTKKSK